MKDGGPGHFGETREMREIKDGRKWRNKWRPARLRRRRMDQQKVDKNGRACDSISLLHNPAGFHSWIQLLRLPPVRPSGSLFGCRLSAWIGAAKNFLRHFASYLVEQLVTFGRVFQPLPRVFQPVAEFGQLVLQRRGQVQDGARLRRRFALQVVQQFLALVNLFLWKKKEKEKKKISFIWIGDAAIRRLRAGAWHKKQTFNNSNQHTKKLTAETARWEDDGVDDVESLLWPQQQTVKRESERPRAATRKESEGRFEFCSSQTSETNVNSWGISNEIRVKTNVQWRKKAKKERAIGADLPPAADEFHALRFVRAMREIDWFFLRFLLFKHVCLFLCDIIKYVLIVSSDPMLPFLHYIYITFVV